MKHTKLILFEFSPRYRLDRLVLDEADAGDLCYLLRDQCLKSPCDCTRSDDKENRDNDTYGAAQMSPDFICRLFLS